MKKIKLTKQEWEDFWKVLGKDWYMEDDDVPEYVDSLKKSDVFEFTNGMLCRQGKDRSSEVLGLISAYDDNLCLEEIFLKWRKNHDTVTIVVRIKKDKLNDLLSVIKQVGGKI